MIEIEKEVTVGLSAVGVNSLSEIFYGGYLK